ncbi:MAG TPA: amidinotransferase, partial [Flavobacteriaceae bacterium]|nr:amidinotransferase [Flavobacteriaceae bacterium]
MKQKQYTSTILMVEPTAFYYNPETAVNNYFQTETTDSQEDIQKEALEEFQGMVSALRSKGVNVIT